MGKILIIAGIILVILGLAVTYGPRIPWIGRLPGDILIKRDNVTFYFPIMTSIIISIIVSLILYFFRK
ncbi:MAG: DUF2905 domain-containing protein [Syntrophorhabdus sp.]